MGRLIRATVLFFAALILTAIFQPPFVALFASWGWHTFPERIPGDVFNWLSAIVGEAAFPWVASGILGGAAGVWLHYFANSMDQKRPQKPTLAGELLFDFHNVIKSIRNRYSGLSGTRSFRDPDIPPDLRGSMEALFNKTEGFGIPTPDITGVGHEESIKIVSGYLEYLAPFIGNNDVLKTKTAAKKYLSEFDKA